MRAVDLIPSEQRSGQPVGAGRSQGGAYAVLVLVAGLALMTLLYGKADHQISSRTSQAAALATQAQRVESEASQLAPYTSFLALREQRTQAVETLLQSRFDWAHVFHEFGRVLPFGTSVSALTGTVGSAAGTGSSSTSSTSSSTASTSSSTPSTSGTGTATSGAAASAASVTSATPAGSVPTFTLSGCALGQPVVAQMLQRLRLIDGVSEVALQSSSESSSGGGGASAGGGGCPANDPSYTVQITFDPLPSSSAVSAATKTVSDAADASSTAGASTSTGVSSK